MAGTLRKPGSLTEADLNFDRALCMNDLRFLCRSGLNYKPVWGKVHDELATFMDKPSKQKLVMLPRGHLKTAVVTKAWSIQQALRNYDIRILIANAVWDNARKSLGSIQAYLSTGSLMSQLFGVFESPRWNQDECTIKMRKKVFDAPTFTTTGLERELTGQHFDLIILDDLVAKENTATPLLREKVKDYYGMLYALLEPRGKMVVIGTRYHQDDLYSQILEDPKFDKFIRTAYTDSTQSEVLYPERFSMESLAEIRKDAKMGSTLFSAQYLNDPIDPENADFRKEQIHYYDPTTPNPGSLYLTVDPAISLSRDADYSALVVTGMFSNKKIRVVDRVRARLIPSDLVNAIFDVVKKWRLHRVGIETFAFQKTLKYDIQREQRARGIFFSIDELGRRNSSGRGEPILSKEARIRRLQPYFEQGLIEIREDMKDLETEILSFPRGKHDDLLDALSYQLDYLVPSMEKASAPKNVHGSYGWWIKNHSQQPQAAIYDQFFADIKATS